MRKLFACLIILAFVGLDSCKKNPTEPSICDGNWAVDLSALATAYTNAAITYTGDPTVANCNAYKDAAQDYLDALEPYLQCTGWTAPELAALQAAIDETQDAIDNLVCAK